MKFLHNNPYCNIKPGNENGGPTNTGLETRGPKGLKMVFFKCVRAITFVSIDPLPSNFNTIIFATEESLGLQMEALPSHIGKLEAQRG